MLPPGHSCAVQCWLVDDSRSSSDTEMSSGTPVSDPLTPAPHPLPHHRPKCYWLFSSEVLSPRCDNEESLVHSDQTVYVVPANGMFGEGFHGNVKGNVYSSTVLLLLHKLMGRDDNGEVTIVSLVWDVKGMYSAVQTTR
ncbi:hypothetical protein NFI96_008209 [Prochilodus magdalenae]|nr:hypothetical protein NFI96_008209 [Prochilodus magdalenae]